MQIKILQQSQISDKICRRRLVPIEEAHKVECRGKWKDSEVVLRLLEY